MIQRTVDPLFANLHACLPAISKLFSAMRTASLRQRSKITGGTLVSCTMISPCCIRRSARKLSKSGSPDPVPSMTSWPVVFNLFPAASVAIDLSTSRSAAS